MAFCKDITGADLICCMKWQRKVDFMLPMSCQVIFYAKIHRCCLPSSVLWICSNYVCVLIPALMIFPFITSPPACSCYPGRMKQSIFIICQIGEYGYPNKCVFIFIYVYITIIAFYSFPGSHGNSHLSNQQTQEQMETTAFGHCGKKIKITDSYTFAYDASQNTCGMSGEIFLA